MSEEGPGPEETVLVTLDPKLAASKMARLAIFTRALEIDWGSEPPVLTLRMGDDGRVRRFEGSWGDAVEAPGTAAYAYGDSRGLQVGIARKQLSFSLADEVTGEEG